ncbi:MAG: hypothetical protein E6Q32_00775 [Neisseriales bacterium]|nr:MAG: hypothetical protein E6Q32_00775 [Neisseriales bacterium]
MTKTAIISIKNNSEDVVLQKEQKRFNKLTADISRRRRELLELNDAIAQLKINYVKKIVPVQNKHSELIQEMIYLADENFDNKIFTKADRKSICVLLDESIGSLDEQYINDRIKDIFARRLGENFDDVVNEANSFATNRTKEFLNEMFGMDVDCDDNVSQEELMHRVRQKFMEQEEQERLREEQSPKRKKSAKTLAKEAREKEAEKHQSQSIREVYRQLAKSLHPDRIANDEDYETKTKLMQEVNAAYEKDDLLTLLEIQLKIEQISQENIDGVALEKLKHFNVVLKRQFDELNIELHNVSTQLSMEFPNLNLYGALTPKKIEMHIRSRIKQTKQIVEDLQTHLEFWKMDIKLFRMYIREVVDLNQANDDFADELFELEQMMSGFKNSMRK